MIDSFLFHCLSLREHIICGISPFTMPVFRKQGGPQRLRLPFRAAASVTRDLPLDRTNAFQGQRIGGAYHKLFDNPGHISSEAAGAPCFLRDPVKVRRTISLASSPTKVKIEIQIVTNSYKYGAASIRNAVRRRRSKEAMTMREIEWGTAVLTVPDGRRGPGPDLSAAGERGVLWGQTHSGGDRGRGRDPRSDTPSGSDRGSGGFPGALRGYPLCPGRRGGRLAVTGDGPPA